MSAVSSLEDWSELTKNMRAWAINIPVKKYFFFSSTKLNKVSHNQNYAQLNAWVLTPQKLAYQLFF